ncbi:hypothetical protein BS78_09G076300 [Paspalum vaginatum]|nr:hypothetical protein BS78_09G076300 [Paspalum vaginatum]
MPHSTLPLCLMGLGMKEERERRRWPGLEKAEERCGQGGGGRKQMDTGAITANEDRSRSDGRCPPSSSRCSQSGHAAWATAEDLERRCAVVILDH